MKPRPQGWWVDQRVPDLSRILTEGLKVDARAFAQWLAPHIGRYRKAAHIRATLARPAYNLREIARDAPKLASLLHEVSPQAKAVINWALDEANAVERLERDLRLLAVVARAGDKNLSGKRGRNPETARDKLLAAIIKRLRAEGLTATNARSVAKKIMAACGVYVPSKERSIQKAVQRGCPK